MRLTGRAISKYRNVHTEVDGIKFPSKKEAKRYQELKLLERAGEVLYLKLQPSYSFLIRGGLLRYPSNRVVKYIADFSYIERKKGGQNTFIVEDVKGFQTPVFKLKAALMKAVHGIEVRIT